MQVIQISGNARQIGNALGTLAKDVMADYLAQSQTWALLQPWRGHSRVETLAVLTRKFFPHLWDEIEGMAEALAMPVHDLFLWNCRGDLINKTQDGCTTIAWNGAGQQWIAHNEDGDPFLSGRCFLVDVQPDDAVGFISFYYPGSLPGHTLAMNRAGLVQTINNLRTLQLSEGVPRMVLSRAVLDTNNLDAAVTLLQTHPRAGGFHHTLGRAGDERLLSVEATPASCSVERVVGVYGHANHIVHGQTQTQPQIITDSSRDRQARLADLLKNLDSTAPDESTLRAVLADTGGDGLPIYREDPNDPDDENTLATAVFELGQHQVKAGVVCGQEFWKHTIQT